MKLSELLASRKAILRQANLAQVAQAFASLKRLTDRIAASKLRGTVTLQQADADEDRYWIALTALDFQQSIVEEHFSDEDLIELADAIEFTADADSTELTLRLEEIASRFLTPLARELTEAGVVIDALKDTPTFSPLATETKQDAESPGSK